MSPLVVVLAMIGEVGIQDHAGHAWSTGDAGTVTRMVNAPVSPRHIEKFMRVQGTVTGLAKNTADMLDGGMLVKVRRGSKVTLLRVVDGEKSTYPYVECMLEDDGKKTSVCLVLEKSKDGTLRFFRPNDGNLEPLSR
jgi:hypothetical protein